MTMSSKLAVDFVKRHYDSFKFESQPAKASTLTAYHVRYAYLTVGNAYVHPFCFDTGSTNCMMVMLPARLKADNSTLDEMFKQIEREDMNMRALTDPAAGPNKSYRVTTNRLLVLEELMLRSGLLKPAIGFTNSQQELLNKLIEQLRETAQQNYNNIITKLDSLSNIVNS